ncbi:23S rRNA (uracil(747)-C(5))-methyltransferase RlmC [Nocardioides sp. Bht2]|uniref:23S rRNA (uracil(747)-C(5))-methyltransferase RlmC n=1 Tax=Nocardioides sp. Bht2 TaxID=3392297 RepID=UPI0039B405A6
MDCHHFAAGRCRSCNWLEQPVADQVTAKERGVRELLAPWPELSWLEPVRSREAGFRNKAKLVVSGSIEAPVLGILDGAGHGVDLSDCPLYPAALAAAFAPLTEFITRAALAPYDLMARRGELKYLLVTVSPTGELMVRWVLRSTEPLARIKKHLPWLQAQLPQLRVASLNIQPEHKAILEGEREILLTEVETLPMELDGVRLQLRPQSFFQTNTEIAAALYRQARSWVDDLAPSSAWDLYCGVGGFALHCAAPGRVMHGVEISAEAVQSAITTATELGSVATFEAGDATAWALAQPAAPELVVVNPPRRGIGPELAAWLETSVADAVLYSSCNAVTLARDLAAMPSLRPVKAVLLDMFPHTAHYEVLTLLRRG